MRTKQKECEHWYERVGTVAQLSETTVSVLFECCVCGKTFEEERPI